MAKRTKYACSVISYVPDYIRGEQFNIGVLMLDEHGELFDYTLLPQNTPKLNSITVSSDDKNLFKETLTLLDFLLKKLKSELPIDIKVNMNRLEIKGLPDTIRLSNLIYGISSNLPLVLDHLTETYVGSVFFGKNHKAKSLAEEFAQTYFEENKFTENNLVPRATFKPSSSIPFKYTADYAYFNADSTFSIISTLPSTEESLENWYQKNNLLTRQFEKYGDIVYLYDNLKFTTEKHQILDDLNNQTEKIKIFDVKKDFEKLESFSTLTLANSSKKSVQEFLEKLA